MDGTASALAKYVVEPTVLQRISITPPDHVVPIFVETWSGQSIRNQIHLGGAIMEVHLSGPGWVEGEWLGPAWGES